MKYYLIPVEYLHFEDEQRLMQKYLKNMYPHIYRFFKVKGYKIDESVLKLLQKEHIPTHFLFEGKKLFLQDKVQLVETITQASMTIPQFYAMSYEVKKEHAVFYLRNLTEEQICTIGVSFYNFIHDKTTRFSKIIPFPLARVK